MDRIRDLFSGIFIKLFTCFTIVFFCTAGSLIFIDEYFDFWEDQNLPTWAKSDLESIANLAMQYYSKSPFDKPIPLVDTFSDKKSSLYLNSRIYVVKDGSIINKVKGINKKDLRHREFKKFMIDNDDLASPKIRIDEHSIITGPVKAIIKNEPHLAYISRPIKGMSNGLMHEFNSVWILVGVLALTFNLLVCYFLAKYLMNPLLKLKMAIKNIARGNLNTKLPYINRNDQIGKVANSLSQIINEQQQHLNNQKRLLGDISHELRSPLTRLNLAAALSNKKNGNLTEVDRIQKEANKLEEMIGAILRLSRIQIDDALFEEITVDELLGDIKDGCEFEAEQKNKKFIYSNKTNIKFFCVIELMQRSIENICRNALKYAKYKITLNVKQTKRSIIFVVRDDGDGLPAKELNQIFRPFYRSGEARDRDSGGVGLGLAITESAVRKHGGKIAALNLKTGGLKIIISIPIKL